MAIPDPSYPPSHRLVLLLDALLDELASEGFPRAGIPLRLRIAELLNRFSKKRWPTVDTFKYQLAALCCHSAVEQEKFYQIFEAFVARHEVGGEELAVVATPGALLPEKETANKAVEKLGDARSAPLVSLPSSLPATARNGPIALELTFYDDGFRPWNLPELEPIVRAWREKEWTLAEDWDIPASIRRTIRAGGVPHFTRRRRRKAPLYLFLIEQQSPRDHLAALYADLVLELQRRDVDADYYFYGDEPHHCWKDRRNPAGYVTIEQLLGTHDGSRLILVGEPEGLLNLNDLRPTALVRKLQEDWPAVALLCTRSTAAWGAPETVLSHLFPVVPAGLAGLDSLLWQWTNRQSYTRAYWQSVAPEPVIPDLDEMAADANALPKIVRNLRAYLGKQGFQWLCAIAVYPELYWRLTKLLHDEAVPAAEVPDEGVRRQVWLFALRRLAQLNWLRRGALPPKVAVELRKMLPSRVLLAVREELLKVLGLEENKKLPGQSYARQDRAYTVLLLKYEQDLDQPERTVSQRMALEAAFRERIEREQFSLTDIANAVGREVLQSLLLSAPAKQEPGFQVLWVDDEPKNNFRFQDELNELMHVITTNVTSTEAALTTLADRGFDLIVSDVSRHRRDDEGAKMLRAFRESSIATPVIFYTTTPIREQHSGSLLELGALGVFSSKQEVQKFIGERVIGKQQGSAAPANREDTPAQQQAASPPPDERVVAAKAAQEQGDEALKAGNFEAAEAAYQQALRLFTEMKDEAGRGNTYQALGKLAVEMHDLEKALQHLKTASTIYLLLDFQPAYAYALMDIGSVQHKMQQLEAAQKSYEEALEILEGLGDEENLAEVRDALGKLEDEVQKQPVELATKITTEQLELGLLQYYIPSQVVIGEKFTCKVRVAATKELLQTNWEANQMDIQLPIPMAELVSVELDTENESEKKLFNIKHNSSEQIVAPSEYSEWNFEVESKRIGTYTFILRITLLDEDNRKSTQVQEKQVKVTDKRFNQAKKGSPIRKRK